MGLGLLLNIVLAPLCAGGQGSPGSHPLPHPLALSWPDKIQEGEYPKAEKAGLVSSAAVGCCSSEIFATSDPRGDAGLLGFWIFTLLNLIWPGEGKGVGEGVAARRDLATRTERGEYEVEEKAKLACKAMLPTFLLRTEEQSH